MGELLTEEELKAAIANATEVVEWLDDPYPDDNPADSELLARALLVYHEAAEDNARRAAPPAFSGTIEQAERFLAQDARVAALEDENQQLAAGLKAAMGPLGETLAKHAAIIDGIRLEIDRAREDKIRAAKDGGIAGAVEILNAFKLWVAARREAETAERPDENAYKRVLVATWNQVEAKVDDLLAKLGGGL